METRERNHSGLLEGLMVGSFLGAAAGIFLAPKSGKELRSDIKGEANKAVDGTKQFYSDSRAKFSDTMACLAGGKKKAR